MPLMDPPRASAASTNSWRVALQKCLSWRIDPSKTRKTFQDLRKKSPLPARQIADIILSLRAPGKLAVDPLLPWYISEFLDQHLLSAPALLLALLNTSPYSKPSDMNRTPKPGSALPTLDEEIFQLVATVLHNQRMTGNHRPDLGINMVYALTRWLKSISDFETSRSMTDDGMHALDHTSLNTYDALAMLVVSILGDVKFREVQKQSWWKQKRPAVRAAIEAFNLNVGQWMSSQNTAHLQTLLSLPPLMDVDDKGFPRLTDQQVRDSVAELPVVTTRASLYIWLNASLCARPLTDEITMLQYLQARSNGNVDAVVMDLLIAGFDVLSSAMLRRESRQQVKLIKSFLCNRVPLLLTTMAGTLVPVNIEQSIQMAFGAINMDPLPPLTEGANDIREALKLTRLEFLQACALHGLVHEATVAAILQAPIMLPRVAKLNKATLVSQCAHNTGKLEALVDDLDGMQGNAGAIAECVVDTINNYCNSKDMMSLKSTCMALIKRIPCIDIVMQYTRPSNLLLPLCNILNNWVHEQDQTELQPPYEEFSTILLLVLVVIHRYNLEISDIGFLDSGSIVAKLMQDPASSVAMADLSQEQKNRLGKWIEGLYTTDESGETSGIGDEVMSQCPPQAFYQLVPTLFEQTVFGCRTKLLPLKTMKGGIEFLLEPFLLPSLVGGLSWLIKHSWEDNGDADILLAILDKLLKPSSSSSDTQAMHKAILSIVGTPLERSLEQFHANNPNRREIEGFLKILKPHVGQQRTYSARKEELNDWSSTIEGGMRRRLMNDMRDVLSWITSVGPNPPPKFTYRLFATAVRTLGAHEALDAIAEEIAEQNAQGKGAGVLEIATALVCAPDAGDGHTANLQGLLQLITMDVQGLLDRPIASAEALIRLQRRVDAHHAMALAASTALPVVTQDQAADQIMQDLGLTGDGATVAAAGTDLDPNSGQDHAGAPFHEADFEAAINQPMHLGAGQAGDLVDVSASGAAGQTEAADDIFAGLGLDTTGAGPDLSLGGAGSGNQSAVQQNPDDDIFAGLDIDFGDDYNFG